jgi:hypothetical protein
VTELDAVLARAMPIADAVLWEGYVLYPYRRSAAKNRIRFQWGVVGPAEEPTMLTTVLVDPAATDRVRVRVRFLHLRRRDDGWDEAVDVHRDVDVDLARADVVAPIRVGGGVGAEPLLGTLRITSEPDGALLRLTVEVTNPADAPASREDALLHSFVGCHLLFAADVDAFVSLLEPPDDAAGAATRCRQHRCWPVLVGPAPRRDLVLASPVILYDYAAVAPESVGDFFDGTEIDEMLTLRVQTMTDEEKAEARATDPRAAAIIDRCDTMPADVQATLHGTSRDVTQAVDPNPAWSDRGPTEVLVAGRPVTRGSKVVLRPRRRADAHDLFLIDRAATVAEVVHDVDGGVHLAVTVDDDPGADLLDWYGRYLYFAPDEVVVVDV